MSIKTIHLSLARVPGNPQGDPSHGYEFRAPLDAAGKLDAKSWEGMKGLCTVRRFAPRQDDEKGLLIRTRGGRWVFSYAPGDDDDEAIFRLADHVFKPGEYISITEHDGVQRTFKVDTVKDWKPV